MDSQGAVAVCAGGDHEQWPRVQGVIMSTRLTPSDSAHRNPQVRVQVRVHDQRQGSAAGLELSLGYRKQGFMTIC